MPVESFYGLESEPPKLTRGELQRVFAQCVKEGHRFNYRRVRLTVAEIASLQDRIRILQDENVQELIRDGNLTLAMIRPNADENTQGLSDVQAVEAIYQIIAASGKPLRKVFEISVILDKATVAEIYQGPPRDNQLKIPPLKHPDKFANRWEEFADSMTNGPTTFILFFAEDGEAPEHWRDLVGRWDYNRRREMGDTGSIRAILALADNYNNLVHGSDSPQAVAREVDILIRHLQGIIARR